MVYLDNASLEKPKKEVIDAVIDILTNHWYNPSSIYEEGLECKRILERSRIIIAKEINCEPEEVIFCSCASEANSLMLRGFKDSHKNPYIITSNYEHHSISDFKVDDRLYVNCSGQVIPTKLESKLKKIENKEVLVSCMLANNEIGVINDIRALNDIAHEYGAIMHSDCTAAFGHMKIDTKQLKVDALTIASQKIGGIVGCAVLYLKKGTLISPIVTGMQENGLKGGTYSLANIVAFSKAVSIMDLSKEKEVKDKRDYCLQRIYKVCTDSGNTVYLNGSTNRLSNNINVQIKGVDAQELIAFMGLYDIYISSGSACSSGEKVGSHVLRAIGLSEKESLESIRITLSQETTYRDIDEFINVLQLVLTQFWK